MSPASLRPAPRMPSLSGRKAALPVLLLGAGLLVWWLMSLDRIDERTRNEDVEMIDIAVPPPPPPPPVPEEQPEVKPEDQPQETTQSVQPDPLSPPQPATTNPPAGDLSSLLQDPSADSGAFVGGARGQGGTGKGPLIGGTGSAGASRAYAERVMLHVRRQVSRSAALKGKAYRFRLRLSVSPRGAITLGDLRNVTPPELQAVIDAALKGLGAMDAPPPEGMPNFINIDINQS